MSDGADIREQRRFRWAVALLGFGLLVALVPALIMGDDFISFEFNTHVMRRMGRLLVDTDDNQVLIIPDGVTSLKGLATSSVAWAIGITTLLFAPVFFAWWRRSAIGFGRLAGVAACVAAACEFSAMVLTTFHYEYYSLGGTWWTVPLGGALMAAAFYVAPAPRRRDE